MNIEYEYNDNVDPAYKYEGGYGICKAIYTANSSSDRNPFIDALPRMLTSDQIVSNYYKPCPVKPNTRIPVEEQILQVSVLGGMRIPLPFVETLERQFSLSLIESYRKRYKFGSIRNIDIVVGNRTETQSIAFRTPMGGDTGNGFTLLGVGGCGKTEAVSILLNRFPQVIQHEWEFGSYKQIVWLYVITPANANLSDLYIAIGRAIDVALGNDEPFYETLVRKAKTVGQKAMCISNLINKLHIGALILDEIQNIANEHVREGSLDSIVQIINTTKVSLNIIGTESAFYGLFYKYYINRRAGAIILANEYCRNKSYWETMIKLITGINWFEPGDFELTSEISDMLYEKTHGIIDRVLTLWSNVQKSYIYADTKPVVTSKYISVVNEEKNPLMGEFTKLALDSCPVGGDDTIPENQIDNLYNVRAAKSNKLLFSSLKDIEHPIDAMEIYKEVKEHLAIEDRIYNDTTIIEAIAHVMKLKNAKGFTSIEIIEKVIKYLKRRKTDRRN